MKKLLMLLAALGMIIGLVGCPPKPKPQPKPAEKAPIEKVVPIQPPSTAQGDLPPSVVKPEGTAPAAPGAKPGEKPGKQPPIPPPPPKKPGGK